ncbi:nuclear RNA export factor 1 S homeolog [Xenopus laevis]|uniref:Nuclear RNA export factor 1 n=1 Tax=Xenopus laevis TaxID=8355 RepID=Q6IRQ2_XENLA|nr:nuclear RNA export factor 1 S homeolog [Xenopus laevis]AAH70656.1 MGC82224 protein [Xenopus laevis]
MSDGGRCYSDHDDHYGGGFFVKKRKGRGPFVGKMVSEGPHKYRNKGGYGPYPRSRLEEDDGDVGESYESSHHRFLPYGRGGKRSHEKRDKKKFGGFHRDSPHQGRAKYNEGWKSWYKVTIPHGKKYDKFWLLDTLQDVCPVPFTPVQFHTDHSRAHFYVDNSAAGKALKQISRTITDRDNFKVTILTRPCPPPQSLAKELNDEEIEHFKNCMQKRYDGANQAMDMKAVRSDPDLVANKVDVILNRKCYMTTMLQIIEDNVPELLSLDISNNKLFKLDDLAEITLKAPNLKILKLSENMIKSDLELNKLKGLKLEELWLEGNPFCDSFRDQTSYISVVRQHFPKLLRLDGHELPPPITFDVETPTTLPPCKGSYLASDDIKALVLRFLQQFYACYDSEDRQGLLNVYHDEACCSLSIPFSVGLNPSRSTIGEYFKYSRNIRKLRDANLRFKLLKQKRLNVVGFLNELPRTQHDLGSFVVDILAHSNTLLCFVVNGIFKEVEGQSSHALRAFSRVFVAVPGSDGGLLLVNDEQFIRDANTEEIHKAFATTAPTPSSSPVHVLASQDMVLAFIQLSGMNSEWSHKCLEDNGWDYDQATQVFMKLNTEGKIPDVAFIK